MKVPDWKDAPKWAKYLAQNLDGAWYWYASRPLPGREMWQVSAGKCALAQAVGSADMTWDRHVEARP